MGTPRVGFHPKRAEVVQVTSSPLAKMLLDAVHLGLELPFVPGTDVGLEHESDARVAQCDLVDRLLDNRHHLVPLALDVGEHRVGLARETRGADHPDSGGDGLADASTRRGSLASGGGVVQGLAGRADAERDDHALSRLLSTYCMIPPLR